MATEKIIAFIFVGLLSVYLSIGRSEVSLQDVKDKVAKVSFVALLLTMTAAIFYTPVSEEHSKNETEEECND